MKSMSSPWSKGSPRSEQQRSMKRKAILAAAAELFADRGYHQVSLDDIAMKLKVTKPTIYYYFENKDQLFFECANVGFTILEDTYGRLKPLRLSGAEKLSRFLLVYAEYIESSYGRALMRVGDYELLPDERSRIRQLFACTDQRLRSLIQEAVQEGSIVTTDVKLTAFALGGLINSIGHWYRAVSDESGRLIAEHFVRLVMSGLLRRDTPNEPTAVWSRREGK
jgi:AcrR family transcriptional regulator